MGFSTNLKFIIVVIGVGVSFYTYPPPAPSQLLTEWKETGTYFTFKGYRIFYKGTTKSNQINQSCSQPVTFLF